MTLQNKRLYESQSVWDQTLQLGQKNLAQAIIDFFPENIDNVLDVGCGDGKLTAAIIAAKKCKVIGLDASQEALSRCSFKTIQGDATAMPFDVRQFDLVLTTDMMEHLPQAVETMVWEELFRVSNKWVMVAVPFREELLEGTAQCAHCGKTYHVNWHMRAYDWPQLVARCPLSYELDKMILTGEPWCAHPPLETQFRRHVLGEWGGWVDSYCPHCHSPGKEADPVQALSPLAARVLGEIIYDDRSHVSDVRQYSEVLVLYRRKDMVTSPPIHAYNEAYITHKNANLIVFDSITIENNLVPYPLASRAVHGIDGDIILQFPLYGRADFLEIQTMQDDVTFHLSLEDGIGIVFADEISIKKLGKHTIPLMRRVTSSYYGILVRIQSFVGIKSIQLGEDHFLSVLDNPNQLSSAYTSIQIGEIPAYLQVIQSCYFDRATWGLTHPNNDSSAQYLLKRIQQWGEKKGKQLDELTVELKKLISRHIVMLCHDQHLDRRVMAQCQTLIESGHKVTLFCLSYTQDNKEEYLPEGVHLIRIGLKHIVPENQVYQGYLASQRYLNKILNKLCNHMYIVHPLWKGLFRLLFGASHFGYQFCLYLRYWNRRMTDPLPFRSAFFNAACDYQPDIIQVHDLPALAAGVGLSKKWQIPLVYDAHELYPEQSSFSWMQRRICSDNEKKWIPFCRQVFAVNDSIAEEMEKRYAILRPTTLTNAIDPPPTYDPDASYQLLREKLNIGTDRKIVLFQGGFSLHRNLEKLIRAMKLVKQPNVLLVMMGFGDFGLQLEKEAKALGLLNQRIYFLPAVPQAELLQHSASADVGIIPYPHVDLNSYYCTPNKLFEFIQAGLPILANDSPELKRFVQDTGFGMVRSMHTSEGIALAIDDMFSDVNQYDSYKKQLKKDRVRYTWHVQSDIYLEKMKPLLEEARR